MADALTKMRDYVDQDEPCDKTSSLTFQPSKKQKTAVAPTPALAPDPAAPRDRAPAPSPAAAPTLAPGGWGGGWGSTAPCIPKRVFTKEESRARGCFICKPGKEGMALHPDLKQ